jgi:hypothetical protein
VTLTTSVVGATLYHRHKMLRRRPRTDGYIVHLIPPGIDFKHPYLDGIRSEARPG